MSLYSVEFVFSRKQYCRKSAFYVLRELFGKLLQRTELWVFADLVLGYFAEYRMDMEFVTMLLRFAGVGYGRGFVGTISYRFLYN